MNKEEILRKSKNENRNRQDEREQYIEDQAGKYACAVGGIVCCIIMLMESVLLPDGLISYNVFAIYASMCGTMQLVKYMHFKKVSNLIFALIELACAIILFIIYVRELVH